jgi:hypothetical protein
MNKVPRQYSMVKLTGKSPFLQYGDNKFIYLGEIPNVKGHCVVYGVHSDRLFYGIRIENFEEVEDE